MTQQHEAPFTLGVMCKELDWQIDCAAQICCALMTPLSGAGSTLMERGCRLDGRTLCICAALSEEVSRALQVNEVGSDPGSLPGLQEIVIGAADNLFGSFVHTRQVAGRPLAVRSTLSNTMTSNPHPNSALAVGMSLLTGPQEVGAVIAANAGKRNKRFDPYAPSKNKHSSSSPYPVVPTGFADPNMAMLQHAH
ncbi:hypothetical protein EDB86DRAFT_2049726 [Lactarius hatsudake]|nr:hypothetical protein EDB86DRAFT_2049726 [Lactarius hatsudake]